MKTNRVIVITAVLLFVSCIGAGFIWSDLAGAQEQPAEPKPITYEWPGVKCTVSQANQAQISTQYMLCRTEYPLMTERLATYGTIKNTTDRSGSTKREFDTSQKDKLTIPGDSLYKDLMTIIVGKLFAIYQAPIGYNSVTIIPYEQVPWNEQLIEPIRKAFEKAQKLDQASE